MKLYRLNPNVAESRSHKSNWIFSNNDAQNHTKDTFITTSLFSFRVNTDSTHPIDQSFPRDIGIVCALNVSSTFPLQVCIYCYRQTSNIDCTISQNLNVFLLVLQLALPNPLKPGVKSRMKM